MKGGAMNILKDFDEFKTFCSMRWDTTDGKGFYCHHTNGSCNEHACFLLEHSCEECAADNKESPAIPQQRKGEITKCEDCSNFDNWNKVCKFCRVTSPVS
jgi:hypothetical protein